jgi:hypothetical protein
MKALLKTVLLICMVCLIAACGNSRTEEEKAGETPTEYGVSKVEVYYFHTDRRCKTCLNIEEVAQNLIKSDYSDQDVKFYSINFDNDENKAIAEKYNVTWSSLFVTSGEKFEDLTDLAFQVANSEPQKLSDKMKEVIDLYLNIE